jgi:hypothetical protein
MMTAPPPANGGTMTLIMHLSRGLISRKDAMIMQNLTPEQSANVDRAERELRRRIQQMAATGQHDIAAIKAAMQRILEGWT